MPNDIVIIPGSKVITFQDGSNTVQRLSITGSGLKFSGPLTSSGMSVGSNLTLTGASTSINLGGYGIFQAGSFYGDTRLLTDRYRLYNYAGSSIIQNILSTGYTTWYLSGSAAMTLNATGLGIGTSSPISKLTINGGTGDGATYDSIFSLIRTSSTGNVLASKIVLDDKNTNYGNLVFRIKSTASSAENSAYYTDAVTIDGQYGYVGIGTSSPGNSLHIQGPVGDGIIAIQPATGGRQYNIESIAGSNFRIYDASAGVERLRIDYAQGNVGIGTSSPSAKLHVSASVSTNAGIFQGVVGIGLTPSSAIPRLQVYGTSTTNAESRLAIYTSNTGTAYNNGLQLGVNSDSSAYLYNYSNTALTFATNGTERMRITSGGSVGIGTSSPNTALHVITTTATGSRIQLGTDNTNSLMDANKTNDLLVLNAPWGSNAASVSNAGAKWGIKFIGSIASGYDNTKTSAIYAVSEDTLGYNRGTSLAFYTNQLADGVYAERMRILHNGAVGIGTTSPSSRFEVVGSTFNRATFKATANVQTGIQILRTGGSNTDWEIYAPASSTDLRFYNGADLFTLNTSGSLGIGTSSPAAKLHINDVTAPYIRITRTGTPTWELRNNYPSTEYGFSINNVTAGTTVLFAGQSGNVGIGTTSPGAKLHVSGSSTSLGGIFNGRLFVGTTSGVGQDFVSIKYNSGGTYSQGINIVDSNSSASGAAYLVLRKSDDTYIGNIRRSSTDNAIYVGGNSYLALGTGDTEKVRIDSNGNVGIGTNSPDIFSRSYGRILAITGSTSAIELNSATGTYVDLGVGGTRIGGLFASSTSYEIGTPGNIPLSFYTNGTTKVSILANGNVGIGTSNPASLLDLYSTAARIKFRRGAAYDMSFGMHDSSTSALSIKNSSDTSTIAYFQYDGAVGIGTTSFSYTAANRANLELYGSTDSLIALKNSNGNFYIQKYNSDVYFWNGNNGVLVFANNNTEKMRIATDGNVGIGTTSPSARLHVSSSARFDGVISQNNYYRRKVIALSYPGASFGAYRQYIRLWPASGGGSNLFSLRVTLNGEWNYAPIFGELKADYSLYLPGDNTISTVRDFRVSFLNYPAASHLRIGDAVIENGYVSIPVYASDSSIIYATIEQWGGNEILASTTSAVSTTLPSTKFQSTYLGLNVNTGSNLSNCYLTLKSSNTERFGISDGTTTANIWPTGGIFYISTETNHPISFITNGSEKMRIAADGNIGIGTSSPANKLHIVSDDSTVLRLKGGTDNNEGSAFYIEKASGGNNTLTAYGDTSSITGGTPDQSVSIWTAGGIPLLFQVAGAEKMRIAADGNVGIGTSTVSQNKLLVYNSSAATDYTGITFSGGTGLFDNKGGISIYNPNSTTNNFSSIDFYIDQTNYSNVGAARILCRNGARSTGGTYDTDLIFITHNQGGTWNQTIINKDGNLGIGTTSPTQRLHVSGSFRVEGGVYDSNNSLGTSASVLTTTGTKVRWVPVSSGASFSGTTNRLVKFTSATTIGDTTTPIFESGSRLGIGTTSPAAKLEVSGSVLDYQSFNRRTGNYTMSLSDASKLIEMNVGTANTVNVPTNAQVAFRIGTKVDIVQYGAGQTTITASGGSGVQIRTANNYYKINARYGAATLTKVGTNEWYMFGNLTP